MLPNLDNDGSGKTPDNWTGGDFDGDGVDEPNNSIVDAGNDKDDLAPLLFHRLGPSSLPNDLEIIVKVSKPSAEISPAATHYFKHTDAEDRVRIFQPSGAATGGGKEIKAGDSAIIGPGPGFGDTFTYKKITSSSPSGPGISEGSYDDFFNQGDLVFGVEGVEIGSIAEITVEVKLAGRTIATDKVSIRVAPFTLSDHTSEANKIYIADDGPGRVPNADFIAKAQAAFPGKVETTPISLGSDVWQQDGYEIGYAKAPYGELPVVLELPRASAPFRSGDLQKFVRQHILAADIGVSTEIVERYKDAGSASIETDDSGGNIESLPSIGRAAGVFFHGSGMSAFQTDFFEAQDVNKPLPVNTDWLGVKHVDEVVSATPDGQRVVIADPDSAWALWLIANEIDPAAITLREMNGLKSGMSH